MAQHLALLPQGPTAPEGLTVRELVSQGRFPHQTLWRQWSARDEQAIQQALELTNTADLVNREVRQLSGGQQQRCWIAMVLAQQTPIILLDEPTTYLDMRVQVDVLELLRKLAHEHGRTIVVVLHELNLAAAYADHLVMMRDGKIKAQGQPDQVFTQANLAAVFDLNAHVIRDPKTQQLLCVPTPSSPRIAPTFKSISTAVVA